MQSRHALAQQRHMTTLTALYQEREALEEEVRQLRAAIRVYTEIARRLAVFAQRSEEGAGCGAN